METPEFLESHLKELLRKINKEKKLILLGDFNIDILKYDTVKDSGDLLDIMTEAFLFPHISSPTRSTTRSRTLIDNIFSNNIEHDTLSGNIITTISDHFAQFLILKNLSHKQDLRNDIYKNDYEKLFENKIHFESDLKNIDWKSFLQLRENDPSTFFDIFITTIKKCYCKTCLFEKVINKRKEKSLQAMDS